MKLFHWIVVFLVAMCGAGLVGYAENAQLNAVNNSTSQEYVAEDSGSGDAHQYHIKKENISCPKCGMHTSLDFEYQDRYTFYCSQCSTIFEVW